MELFPSLNNFPTYRPRPENPPQNPQRAAVRVPSVSHATHTTAQRPATTEPTRITGFTARTDSFDIEHPGTWMNGLKRILGMS